MKNLRIILLTMVLTFSMLFTGCGKKEAEQTTETDSSNTTITILNIKGEVTKQIEDLAAQYKSETGVTVKVISLDAGVDAQAMLKGYFLSDQMPDIIASEASGFGNWEGLLLDMSDQEWASRTDAAYTDDKYGVIGFPYTTEAIGLAYNKSILEKCGINPDEITGPDSMKAAFETIDSKKNELGLTAVIGYCADDVEVGWSSGNHLFGAYLDSGLARTDTAYIDLLNNGGQIDEARFSAFADMIGLFNKYSDPAILTSPAYNDQVLGFASGKYAFVTQGSWIGATMTGDAADAYAAAGNFEVGMIPYCFEEGMSTILTSAPSWWAVPKEGNTEAALAFLQWCSGSSAQKILVEQAGFVSPFKDCSYVASDPFAPVISSYISSGKTSDWHWMQMPSGLGQNGVSHAFTKFAKGEVDAAGFLKEIQAITTEWYSKL